MASIFTFRRQREHLSAADLALVPESGQPLPSRSIGATIGEKADAVVNLQNRIVNLEGELAHARMALREAEINFVEAAKGLGIRPETIDEMSRRE